MVNKKDIIWKDSNIIEIIRIVILIILIILILNIVFLSSSIKKYIAGIILLIVFLFFMYKQIKRKLSYISTNGIFIGNVIHKYGSKIFLKQKSTFLNWNDINRINIVSKGHYGPRGGRSFKYLLINKKNRMTYECLIYYPKGFVDSLKKLNKYHLLSKDSKYR